MKLKLLPPAILQKLPSDSFTEIKCIKSACKNMLADEGNCGLGNKTAPAQLMCIYTCLGMCVCVCKKIKQPNNIINI